MNWIKIERTVASAKFAVVIILIFALAMAVGTFFESYYGTEFAGRAIYKSPFFMGIQGLMLLSIFYALLHRLPARSRLYGFYTIHSGLIVLFCGSFITWYAGVDGQLTLSPETPSRQVSLSRDVLTIVEHDQKELSYTLPYTASPDTIDQSWEHITLKRYFPFSEDRLEWMSSLVRLPSSQYHLANENIGQELVVSLHPGATRDFPAATQLGPLKIYYLPRGMVRCFRLSHASGYIVYNSRDFSCFTPEERKIPLQKAHSGKSFLVVEEDGEHYSFFPEFSPWPLTLNDEKELKSQTGSHLRIFSKKTLEGEDRGPSLLLFGTSLAYYDGGEWEAHDFEQDEGLELPWMGFKIHLLRHEEEGKFPRLIPHYQRPRQINNQLVAGKQRALEIEIKGQTHWVTSDRPLGVLVDGQKYSFYLGNQTIKLPFEINLTRFKMDTDPGTNNPASYESFVNVFAPEGVSGHHIYMNNPLQFSNFTFYQASYFPLEDGRYGSVLSVNFDPGRFWKYLGSFLLVLGSIWHFYLRRSAKRIL